MIIIFGTIIVISLVIWIWRRRNLYCISYKVPGPFLALPFLGNIDVMLPTICSKDMSKTFTGALFRDKPLCRVWFGPMLVIGVSKPEYIQTILNNCFEKGYFYYSIREVMMESILVESASSWKVKRRMLNATFHKEILNSFIVNYEKAFQQILDEIRVQQKKNKEDFDIFHYSENFTFLVTDASFLENDVKTYHIKNYQKEALSLVVKRALNPLFYFNIFWNLYAASKRLQEITDKVHEDFEPTVKGRKLELQNAKNNGTDRSNNKRKRFMEIVFEANTNDLAIKQDMATLIIASTDTATTGISLSLYMIALHQDIQEQIMDEINSVVSPMDKIGNEHLKELKYLERVIKESLRLFPPGPLLNRYIDKDIDLDSYSIPKGTEISISPFYLHRDPQYWPNPLKFDPDRFLPKEIAKRHPYSYIPFSGLEYGMRIMKFFIASLLRNFKIKTKVKSIEEIDIKLFFMLKCTPKYPLELEPRT